MTGAELCVECGAPSELRLMCTPFCLDCWRVVTAPWRERHGLPLVGRGRQAGPTRPDWGERWAELRCDLCGYEWVGRLLEWCERCPDLLDRNRRWQAELVLRGPAFDDVDDAYRADRLSAWAERLACAVDAGIISEAQARAALARVSGVRRVA